MFDDASRLVGFVDLGSTQKSIDRLESSLSSQDSYSNARRMKLPICLFLWLSVSSLIGKWLLPSTPPQPSSLLHYLIIFFWKCVEELEVHGFLRIPQHVIVLFLVAHFINTIVHQIYRKGKLINKTLNPYTLKRMGIFS